jgi:hypothetical protein
MHEREMLYSSSSFVVIRSGGFHLHLAIAAKRQKLNVT